MLRRTTSRRMDVVSKLSFSSIWLLDDLAFLPSPTPTWHLVFLGSRHQTHVRLLGQKAGSNELIVQIGETSSSAAPTRP